jgi:dihydroneopterin aldolase
MTSEIKWAFAHPDERSRGTSGAEPLDRISLRDHIVEVEIGAFQAERGATQRISFNIVVEVRRQSEAVDDDVDRILSYDRVTEAIAHELAAERLNLLETLAERVAERILHQPQAARVFVRIEKLDRGAGALGVEIVRAAGDLAQSADAAQPDMRPQPHVVYLSNAAMDSDNLDGWIAQLVQLRQSVVLCVGAAGLAVPQSPVPQAQRRIDLLAIEQNAWVLGGRDKRCAVVETRTELDWAMKNGQLCVWAPSKIVLDAVDGPPDSDGEALALAIWFARHMGAVDITSIGAELPEMHDLAGRYVDVTSASL